MVCDEGNDDTFNSWSLVNSTKASYTSAFPSAVAPLLPITVNCALPALAFEAEAYAGRPDVPSFPAFVMAFAKSETYKQSNQSRNFSRMKTRGLKILTSICTLEVTWDAAPMNTLNIGCEGQSLIVYSLNDSPKDRFHKT